MKVFISRLKRESKCSWCPEKIKAKEMAVFGLSYVKKRDGKSWKIVQHWHIRPDKHCWEEQGVYAAEERERREPSLVARGRKLGRRMSDLSREDQTKRTRIMARRGSIIQRINKEMNGENRLEKIIHLGSLINKCKVEIEAYGGCPKNW